MTRQPPALRLRVPLFHAPPGPCHRVGGRYHARKRRIARPEVHIARGELARGRDGLRLSVEIVRLALGDGEVVEDFCGPGRARDGGVVVADGLPEVALLEVHVAPVQVRPVVLRVVLDGAVVVLDGALVVAGALGVHAEQKPDVRVLGENDRGLVQAVLRAAVLAALVQIDRRDVERRAAQDVLPRDRGDQRRHEAEGDQAHRQKAALQRVSVCVEQGGRPEQHPDGAQAEGERQQRDRQAQRRGPRFTPQAPRQLLHVVNGARQAAQQQNHHEAQRRRDQGKAEAQAERGERRHPWLPRGKKIRSSDRDELRRLSILLLAKQKLDLGGRGVVTGLVQPHRRVVGAQSPIHLVEPLGQAPLVNGRAREIGEPLDARDLRGLLDLRKLRLGGARVVLEMGVQEGEPVGAVEPARDRGRKRRDRLLRLLTVSRDDRRQGRSHQHDRQNRQANGERRTENPHRNRPPPFALRHSPHH